jgi:2-polyprenyl-3-methyl-5-hydroxy-6-metoxy-1,4-benzoquinol methylase
MGTTTVDAAPDYAAITARQRQVWSAGDYSVVASRIPVISELLSDAADLRAGSRVLDVAGGSGNTALAAARNGARVVSLDYVPSLLERARTRAAA